MGVRCDGSADFDQMKVHGLGVDIGHDQSCPHIPRRTDGAKDIGVRMPLIAPYTRARSLSCPDARQRTFLANTGFILEPDFNGFSLGRTGEDFRYPGGEVFLKASWASRSASG
jgi:hypothetical protein